MPDGLTNASPLKLFKAHSVSLLITDPRMCLVAFILENDAFCAGWGAASPFSGIIVSQLGEKAAFNANLIGGILLFLPTVLLPTNALKERKLQKLGLGKEGGSSAHDSAEPLLMDVQIDPKFYSG